MSTINTENWESLISSGDGLNLPAQGDTTGIMQFSCLTRKRTFSQAIADVEDEEYSCEACQMIFRTSCELKIHDIRIHAGKNERSCSVCGKTFVKNRTLLLHLYNHAEGKKPYSCDVCEKSYAYPNSLSYHRLTHTGVKPYSCPVCQKAFYTNSLLKSHSYVHAEGKPYTCPLCPKRFTRPNYSKLHQRVHTEERRQVVCQDHTFAQNATLWNHQQTQAENTQCTFPATTDMPRHLHIDNGEIL